MIGYGYGNSITNLTPIVQNRDTPEVEPVNKPKKAQKRYKKCNVDDSKSRPEQGTDNRFVDRIPIKNWHTTHQLAKSILPDWLVKKLSGDLLDLHELVIFMDTKLFQEKDPTYQVFIAKVPKGLGFLTEADDADLLFLRFDDIFRMFHMLPLHPSMVRLVALKLAHQIKMEDTPDIVIVDPYYMQEMFVNNPLGRKTATRYLKNLFLENGPKCTFLLPYLPE